ncbi:MAG: agmatine deiminase family protein [Proteobacteria bacterium]|nr:agmatine deiminase family protein [Pseudomonadota bacterium]
MSAARWPSLRPPARPVSAPRSPASLGYRMPGEFEPHDATWLAWPGEVTRAWAEPEAITRTVAALAHAVRRFEPVRVAVDPAFLGEAQALLDPAVETITMPVDDIWIRDSGPTFLRASDGALAASLWNFNAWGEKVDGHDADRTLAARLAASRGVPGYAAPLVTEGGALHVDGAGTAIVTESALLNPNRNPGLSRADLEAGLRGWLGVEKVLWLPGERHDTITDGHVDGLLTFIRPGALLFESAADPADPLAPLLAEQRRFLAQATDARGRRLEILDLVRPPRRSSWSPDFCAIYVNCLLVNGGVLVPAFGDAAADARAVDTFRRAFPERAVLALAVDAICAGGGGIHCVTQQQPASP